MKALAAKPTTLSSIPRPIWWKERTNLCKLSSDLHTVGFGTHSFIRINKWNESFKIQTLESISNKCWVGCTTLGAGEMDQVAKCLSCKREDMSLISELRF